MCSMVKLAYFWHDVDGRCSIKPLPNRGQPKQPPASAAPVAGFGVSPSSKVEVSITSLLKFCSVAKTSEVWNRFQSLRDFTLHFQPPNSAICVACIPTSTIDIQFPVPDELWVSISHSDRHSKETSVNSQCAATHEYTGLRP